MLSRRGLRIKVMQTLYMFSQVEGMKIPAAVQQLNNSIHNSYLAYLYCLHFFTKLGQQQDLEAHIRKNKYLPKEEDLKFVARFFENTTVRFLMGNHYFQSILKKEKLTSGDDEEIEKLIYQQAKEFEPFKNYQEQYTDDSNDRRIIGELFDQFLLKNEYFDEHMENVIATWADDEFIVKGLMDEFVRVKDLGATSERRLFDFAITAEEESFAEDLLRLTIENSDAYESQIEPKLQNWELDRVSLIDRILMKMAITEFMHMPTIPVKVTINEYLDISKIYSTPRSREFINGVLDKVMNELKAAGSIIKSGRGLIE